MGEEWELHLGCVTMSVGESGGPGCSLATGGCRGGWASRGELLLVAHSPAHHSF